MQKQLTPHIHAEVIKAWASGETIQFKTGLSKAWVDLTQNDTPGFHKEYEYRIKPEPKPDIVAYGRTTYCSMDGVEFDSFGSSKCTGDNLKLTFDGETGKLKAVEFINK
jgi:hypothetical protein